MNSREIDDGVLTLAPSGWTYEFTFVLYDYETESMWYPFEEQGGGRRFMGISGQYAGRKLDAMSGELAPWNTWVAQHPDSKLLQ